MPPASAPEAEASGIWSLFCDAVMEALIRRKSIRRVEDDAKAEAVSISIRAANSGKLR